MGYDELNESEKRLCDLLYEVEDDDDFVNDVMNEAYQLELMDEMTYFIEETMNCTREDVYRHMYSFVEMEYVE